MEGAQPHHHSLALARSLGEEGRGQVAPSLPLSAASALLRPVCLALGVKARRGPEGQNRRGGVGGGGAGSPVRCACGDVMPGRAGPPAPGAAAAVCGGRSGAAGGV